MESDYFVNALNSLKKPQEKRRLLQILVAIRKGVNDTTSCNSQRLRTLNEAGCTKNLLMCLQQENASIVDVALSIIGNCCVNSHFARDSIKLNILHSLNRVLEKHREDSIQGRVFRIIGNLCNTISVDTIIFKEPSLIDDIINFLINASEGDTFASEATITMALRSIRKLLRRSTINKLVTKHNILKAISSALLKFTQLWQETKKHEHVLQDLLRLLHAFSQYNQLLAHDIILPLKCSGKLNPLMCLATLIPLNPSRIIKIVLNFSKLCISKSDLPISLIWENLLANMKATNSDSVRKEYLKCMCDLADDPANREYLRLDDNVGQLVAVLKDFTTCTDYTMDCCSIVLSILNKCHTDDLLIMKQIHCGTIPVLTEKLEWICSESSSIVTPKHSKRKRKKQPSTRFTEKKLKLSSSGGSPMDTFPLYLDCNSLERCDSPSECSEISSNGPYSPSYTVVAEDVSDSDDYSPICSDAEDDDMNSLIPAGPIEVDFVTSSDDDGLNLVPDPNKRMKYRLLEEITTLLLRYSRMRPVAMELASPKLLRLLMNISIQCSEMNSTPLNVVTSVARWQECLIPLMSTDFLQMIYDATVTGHGAKNCWMCQQVNEMASSVLVAFTNVAESGAGKGDIAHQLLRADHGMKEKLVLSLPYIIRSKQIVSKLLLNCGGLNIFLQLLLGDSDLRNKSIKGLCVLAVHHLKIKNPVNSDNRPKGTNKEIFDTKAYCLPEMCMNVVTFNLDDGSSIKADRDFLSEKSDYFNRLLCGSFKESEQSEINLQNVTKKSFQCLLRLLHCDVIKMGVVSFNMDLETVLELLELTERYLMVDLNVYLTGCVEQQHITNKTVPMIYQWSIESGTNILRVEVIAFALVADILDSDRLIMFQNLFDLGYSEQLVDDIQKLLIQFLR